MLLVHLGTGLFRFQWRALHLYPFRVWFTIDTAQSVDAMAQSRVQCAVRYLEYFIFVASGAVLLAVQAVLDDPGFEVSSPLAANAVQTAKTTAGVEPVNREQALF